MSDKAIIIGGGPVGCMMACFLAQKHAHLFPGGIEIYERRKDTRNLPAAEAGRSINLAISDRSFYTMKLLDPTMVDEILSDKLGVKMKGRYIHDKSGKNCEFQNYGRDDQFILSVNRRWLNEWLQTKAEQNKNVKIFFSHRCTGIDTNTGKHEGFSKVNFVDESNGNKVEVTARLLLGSDGGNSLVRNHLQKTPNARLNYQQTFISHGYKELCIRPTKDNDFAIRPDSLHIWPRGQGSMLIALPNPTKDFTATVFLPMTGEGSFETLKSDEDVVKFFKEQFPDAYELIKDHLLEDWHENPISDLMHVRAYPHHYQEKVVLIGDAAHAVIPFYGQGCNCGIEDCRYLSDILAKKMPTAYDPIKMGEALAEYSQVRKPHSDAILDLAIANWDEMSSKTASYAFLLQKKIGLLLHKIMPRMFIPLYTMVTFTPEMTYKEAWDTHLKRERQLKKAGKFLKLATISGMVFAAVKYGVPMLKKYLEKKN